MPFLYGANTSTMRAALRIAQLTPRNAPLIYELSSSDFAFTDFGNFLFCTGAVVEKIIRRNVAFGAQAFISHDGARYHAAENIGLKKLSAWGDANRRCEADFQASAEEIGRLPHLLGPKDILAAIDYFAWASHIKEQTQYVNELIDAWKTFRAAAIHHPIYASFVSAAPFLNALVDKGLETVIEERMRTLTPLADIDRTFRFHETAASLFGVEPRTAQIKSILAKYKGSDGSHYFLL